MDLGYARVSTAKQDLDRQVDALTSAGIVPERIYPDRKSGVTTDRPGLHAVLGYARAGDVIVVHTLDRLGRTVRDTLNLIRDLTERGVGVRNLAGPVRVDSSRPEDPMAQLAVVLLALFGQMERTYAHRAAHARSVATAKGVGRPVTVAPAKLAWAVHLPRASSSNRLMAGRRFHALPSVRGGQRSPAQLRRASAISSDSGRNCSKVGWLGTNSGRGGRGRRCG